MLGTRTRSAAAVAPARRLALRFGAAACAAAIGLVWWPAPSVSAQAGEPQVGWWHRLSGESGPASGTGTGGSPAAEAAPPPTLPPSPAPVPTVPVGEDDPPAPPAPVPPPASVPDGGLYVANDAFGPVAIAAVRFPIGEVGSAILTLRFADGAGGAAFPIIACPLLEGFQAVTNGAWRDRPAHDCARASVSGTIQSDGTLAFQLSERFSTPGQSTLDLVILPALGDGSPFSAPFEAVDAAALQVLGGPAPRPPAPAPTRPSVDRVPSAAPAGAPAPRRTPSAPPRTGGVTTPPASPAGDRPAPGAGAGEVPGFRPVADVFDDRAWARWVATAMLGVLAVGMAAASSGRVPALAGIGADGGAGEKGVGRFARRREGPPPALT